MKKLMITAAALASIAGCQTVIEAEKHAEVAHPIQRAVSINGTNMVYTAGYYVTSGGWEASARSPLWADESLSGLNIGVATNGMVTLALATYDRDLSTNAVAITKEMFTGGAKLAAEIGSAIATAGGKQSADAVSSLVRKFIAAGGDANNAKVTCEDGSCTVTDGSITCTDGVCTPN